MYLYNVHTQIVSVVNFLLPDEIFIYILDAYSLLYKFNPQLLKFTHFDINRLDKLST